MNKKIIIDSDMAFGSPNADVDDSLAILMAFALELNVIGINAVGGNVSADKASRNIDKLLKRIGRERVIHSFSNAEPIDPYLWIHNRWDTSTEEKVERNTYPSLPDSINAIKKEIDSVSSPVTIVTIGPMTNIAMFLKTYPEYKERIESIYSMGGTISMPGVKNSPVEFNIKGDPEAAETVFSCGIPLWLFPLDVTKKKRIYPETIESWKNTDGIIKEFYDASIKFMEHRAKRDGYSPAYAFYHDVMPIVALCHPEFFVFSPCSISVELNNCPTRGVTVIDRTKGDSRVAIDVDAEGLFSFVKETISNKYRGVL